MQSASNLTSAKTNTWTASQESGRLILVRLNWPRPKNSYCCSYDSSPDSRAVAKLDAFTSRCQEHLLQQQWPMCGVVTATPHTPHLLWSQHAAARTAGATAYATPSCANADRQLRLEKTHSALQEPYIFRKEIESSDNFLWPARHICQIGQELKASSHMIAMLLQNM